MRIVITAGELMDMGVWLPACELLGTKEQAVSLGLMQEEKK